MLGFKRSPASWGNFLKSHSIQAFALLFAIGIGLSFVISSCTANNASTPTSSAGQSQEQVVRIGYQKSATLLNALKTQAGLEKAGLKVNWTEFPAGPAMLEGLNVGSIDFGYTGETPPIFAQAADAPMVYVASEPLGPRAEAILVPKGSQVKSVAELKGKKVALNKGSNVHYLLVRAIEAAGLQYSDIKPVFLPPADARAAFEKGSVDAWVIWDPFLAAAEKATGGRILSDGKDLVANRGFFLASKSFVEKQPDSVKTLLAELRKTSDWARQNPKEVAEFLSPQLGIDVPVLEEAEQRRVYGINSLEEGAIADQQKIADTFYRLKLIPKQIQVKDVIWTEK